MGEFPKKSFDDWVTRSPEDGFYCECECHNSMDYCCVKCQHIHYEDEL